MPTPEREALAARARAITEDSELWDCLFLVLCGVPFDVAFSLEPDVRLAWVVILGELRGGTFDWGALRWKKPQG